MHPYSPIYLQFPSSCDTNKCKIKYCRSADYTDLVHLCVRNHLWYKVWPSVRKAFSKSHSTGYCVLVQHRIPLPPPPSPDPKNWNYSWFLWSQLQPHLSSHRITPSLTTPPSARIGTSLGRLEGLPGDWCVEIPSRLILWRVCENSQ